MVLKILLPYKEFQIFFKDVRCINTSYARVIVLYIKVTSIFYFKNRKIENTSKQTLNFYCGISQG